MCVLNYPRQTGYLVRSRRRCTLWFDNLPSDKSWTCLWSGYILCGRCSGIRSFVDPCPVCGATLPTESEQTVTLEDGTKCQASIAFAGAETRYEDYIYLQLLEREWNRMTRDSTSNDHLPYAAQVSEGASLVLLFWTYFESRIEYLLRRTLRDLPPRLLEDALKRYSGIGARLNDLYRVAFETTYHSDLRSLGYADVSEHLLTIQRRRNEFAHGIPQSITDDIATTVVTMLKREHESWISVYNVRASRR